MITNIAGLAAPFVSGLLGNDLTNVNTPILPVSNAGLDVQYQMALARLSDPALYEPPEPPGWPALLALGAVTFALVYLATPAA